MNNENSNNQNVNTSSVTNNVPVTQQTVVPVQNVNQAVQNVVTAQQTLEQVSVQSTTQQVVKEVPVQQNIPVQNTVNAQVPVTQVSQNNVSVSMPTTSNLETVTPVSNVETSKKSINSLKNKKKIKLPLLILIIAIFIIVAGIIVFFLLSSKNTSSKSIFGSHDASLDMICTSTDTDDGLGLTYVTKYSNFKDDGDSYNYDVEVTIESANGITETQYQSLYSKYDINGENNDNLSFGNNQTVKYENGKVIINANKESSSSSLNDLRDSLETNGFLCK